MATYLNLNDKSPFQEAPTKSFKLQRKPPTRNHERLLRKALGKLGFISYEESISKKYNYVFLRNAFLTLVRFLKSF